MAPIFLSKDSPICLPQLCDTSKLLDIPSYDIADYRLSEDSSTRPPRDYADRVSSYASCKADKALYSGHHLDPLSRYLRSADEFETTGSPENSTQSDFARLYDFTMPPDERGQVLASPAKIAESAREACCAPSQARILFLKGHPTPDYVDAIGSAYNVDPEFFRQHLAVVWTDAGDGLHNGPVANWLATLQKDGDELIWCDAVLPTPKNTPPRPTAELYDRATRSVRGGRPRYQNASRIPKDYGSELDTKTAINDPFYALNPLFRNIELAERVARLTRLAFVFIPPSFICTFFGMNVLQLGTEGPDIWVWFAIAVPVSLLCALPMSGIPPRIVRARLWKQLRPYNKNDLEAYQQQEEEKRTVIGLTW
ncbi:hypothetical protein M8818_001197 [Zalaria obscura]|uniref:Uncharacterized protein n=1 Tax=Zalaria obscura TaxID=2024903 RepID=A0ACC3SPR6_9PEZI